MDIFTEAINVVYDMDKKFVDIIDTKTSNILYHIKFRDLFYKNVDGMALLCITDDTYVYIGWGFYNIYIFHTVKPAIIKDDIFWCDYYMILAIINSKFDDLYKIYSKSLYPIINKCGIIDDISDDETAYAIDNKNNYYLLGYDVIIQSSMDINFVFDNYRNDQYNMLNTLQNDPSPMSKAILKLITTNDKLEIIRYVFDVRANSSTYLMFIYEPFPDIQYDKLLEYEKTKGMYMLFNNTKYTFSTYFSKERFNRIMTLYGRMKNIRPLNNKKLIIIY
jgi:hypothetical protein